MHDKKNVKEKEVDLQSRQSQTAEKVLTNLRVFLKPDFSEVCQKKIKLQNNRTKKGTGGTWPHVLYVPSFVLSSASSFLSFIMNVSQDKYDTFVCYISSRYDVRNLIPGHYAWLTQY